MSRLVFLLAVTVAAASPQLLDRPGLYTLPQLGYGSRVRTGPVSVHYRLPPATRAGKPFYVGVALHGELRVDASQPLRDVTTTNNSLICSSIRVNAEPTGDSAVVDWDGGPPQVEAGGTSRAPVLRFRFRSICILSSVRGGTSVAAFDFPGLRVFPDSGVVVARRLRDLATPPGTNGISVVQFRGVYPPAQVRAGRSYAIDVRLQDFAQRDAHVVLRAAAPRGPVRVVTPRRALVVRRGPVRTRTHVWVHADRPGRSWVALTVGAEQVLVLLRASA